MAHGTSQAKHYRDTPGWLVRRGTGAKRQLPPRLDLGGASRRTAGDVTERSEGKGASDLDSPAAGATIIEVQRGGRARRAAALTGARYPRKTRNNPKRWVETPKPKRWVETPMLDSRPSAILKLPNQRSQQ